MSDPSRRSLYRIIYPLLERPTLEVGRGLYDVVDCSESGLRYEVRGRRPPPVGTQLGGTLQFRRGDHVTITGEVIRVAAGTVVLALDPHLSFADIMAEQRYLRSRGYTLRD